MENQKHNQTVIINQSAPAGSGKSSTPVVTGSIGFVLGLPAVLCATICAGASAVVSGAAAASTMEANGGVVDPAADAAAVATAGAVGGFFLMFILMWLAGFILSFFGKSKHCKITGILTMLCGVAMGIPCIMTFNFFGLCAAILYIVSGGTAMGNASKA